MQASRQLGEDRVARIGGHAFDHELVARDPERKRGPVLQQCVGASQHTRGGGRQRRVVLGIHGVLVEGDRQLDEEFTELA